MTDIKPMLIGGQWRSGSHAIDNINPSNTNDLVGRYAQGNSGDMQAAITAASDALPEWSATTPQQRHDVLACVAAELTHRRPTVGFTTRPQVTARKPAKHRHTAGVCAFTLER